MKKKSAKKAVEAFEKGVSDIETFLRADRESHLSEGHVTWAYEYAIIRLYRAFENLMLDCLVAAINSDTGQLSKSTGVTFPKHLTDEVCRYIIIGDGYFDFRGRDGLIKTLKRFLPPDHYLVAVTKRNSHKDALDRLSALRNYAAHDSASAKARVIEVLGVTRLAAAGAWLKRQGRFDQIVKSLKQLAKDVAAKAPY